MSGSPTVPMIADSKLQSIQPHLQSREDQTHHGVP